MILHKSNGYYINLRDNPNDSNYNRTVEIYAGGSVTPIMGWTVKETAKNYDIIKTALSNIDRYEQRNKAKTVEEFLNI